MPPTIRSPPAATKHADCSASPLLPDTATTNPSAEDETDAPTTIALPAGIEPTELGNLLADHADDIASATDRFIESLTRTDNGKDHD